MFGWGVDSYIALHPNKYNITINKYIEININVRLNLRT